ncbi:Transposase and inactivated derivatives [hydrothermal vent metagenome]|uniref:Transposase and inactivated derivatives n=1 Tax=hydrothermal vent metagenome TaxID=652676 RepID=A0A3B0VVG0_9ZZZZ
MGRTRYKITAIKQPHFITCTILHWLPIFTRPESVQIIFDSLNYLKKSDDLKLYGFVILENHLHMIISSDDLPKTIQKFKSFTAKQIINLLKISGSKTLLDQMKFYKKAHKNHTKYQVWQEGCAPKLIQSDEMMRQKLEYMHQNPVKRGYVEQTSHWRYSSARNYDLGSGVIEVDTEF